MKDEEVLMMGCSPCEFKDGKYVCSQDEDAIRCFWACNITGNADLFDFEKNIKGNMEWQIEQKLVEHGLLGWKRYADFHQDMYGKTDDLNEFVIDAPQAYVYIGIEELRDELYQYIAEKLNETYSDVEEFKRIKRLYDKLDDIESLSLSEKTALFDEIVHLQHVTGFVIDADISSLKAEFERDVEPYRKK